MTIILAGQVMLIRACDHQASINLAAVWEVGVVVNLASRPPQFLGSACSAPEGLGSQIGANYVRD